MVSPRGWLGLSSTLLLTAVAIAAAIPPAKSGQDAQPAAKEKPSPPASDKPSSPGPLQVPIDKLADVKLPGEDKVIVLSPKAYQDLLDRINRLEVKIRSLTLARGQVQSSPPQLPTKCFLNGQVEGDAVKLRITFEFRTNEPDTAVLLGCVQGHPTNAKLDGQTPLLSFGKEGFVVQVEKLGEHRLELDLELPLVAKGSKAADRGFDLSLPRAVITYLELDVPEWVKSVRFGDGRTLLTTEAVAGKTNRHLRSGPLGPVDRLDLNWDGQAPVTGAAPVLEARNGLITVRVGEPIVTTRVELKLTVRGGETAEWQLKVPPQATIRVPESSDLAKSVTISSQEGPLRTLRLAAPTNEPLPVIIEVQQPRLAGPMEIGPFIVVGAASQRGNIVVHAPSDTRLRCQPHGETQMIIEQRDLTDAERQRYPNALAFTYQGAETGQAAQPFLIVEAESIKGMMEARVQHILRLVRGETDRLPHWRVATIIEGQVVRTKLERLLLKMPPDYELDSRVAPQPIDAIQAPEWIDPIRRIQGLAFVSPKPGPFKITLEGQYAPLLPMIHQVTLGLPRPLVDSDGGCQVTVMVPDDLELVRPQPAGLSWENSKADSYNKRTWTLDRIPDQLDLAWQPYRPELAVSASADVLLRGQQIQIRQQFWFPAGPPPSGQLALILPTDLPADWVNVEGGDRLTLQEDRVYSIKLSGTESKDHPVILTYFVSLPPQARQQQPFLVPLIVPEQVTRGDMRLRVWGDPGFHPMIVEERWEEQPLEQVKGYARWPAAVASSNRLDLPIRLQLRPTLASLATVQVERALIQATITELGQQNYRARFLLTRLDTRHLDVELPTVFSPALNLQAFLNGKELNWKRVDENGQETDSSRIIRLAVMPSMITSPTILEIAYQLTPGRTGDSNSWQSVLHPPKLRGEIGQGPVRWQVHIPASWVALYPQADIHSDQVWGRRGWLLAPHPAVNTIDLDHWITGSESQPPDEDTVPGLIPSLVCWRHTLDPLHLYHVPQQMWLLTCSLLLLTIGLGLYFLAMPRSVFWLILATLGTAVLASGLLWPGILYAAIYGCEPGIAVLLLALGIPWMLHRHYRRQMVFLPGFARIKAGSSLLRLGNNRLPRSEPSTVDAIPSPSISQPWSASSSTTTDLGNQNNDTGLAK